MDTSALFSPGTTVIPIFVPIDPLGKKNANKFRGLIKEKALLVIKTSAPRRDEESHVLTFENRAGFKYDSSFFKPVVPPTAP